MADQALSATATAIISKPVLIDHVINGLYYAGIGLAALFGVVLGLLKYIFGKFERNQEVIIKNQFHMARWMDMINSHHNKNHGDYTINTPEIDIPTI